MLAHLLLFTLGLGILYFGAEWLVKGASAVALYFGIRPLVVGLTIVALGTSMPEFLLNFFAVLIGEDGLAVGNIVGSNIANIGLILGISAVILPLVVGKNVLGKEYPMMLAVTILFYVLALDGAITRTDGGILVAGLCAFLYFLIHDSKRQRRERVPSGDGMASDDLPPTEPSAQTPEQAHSRPAVQAAYLLAGITALAIGARLMVDAAVGMAEAFGVPSIIVGLTIVAIGTSLPELAASVVGVMRKETDLSVGNIIGSNMLNILFVVGIVALIRPMQVEAESISGHFPVMIAFSLVLYPLTRKGYTLSRSAGLFLILAFAGYLGWLIIPLLA